ncbi:hypothetical protein [Halobaculum sp. D14]|uniref:hypothetical protein n=1 Tax=Halobaculum sp. D14 TaxID=3421642 RepID=UPI003EC035C3
MSEDSSSVYAAAQGRTFLAGELEGHDPEYVHEFAGLIGDKETLDLLNYLCALWRDEDESFLDTRLGTEIVTSAATHQMDRAFKHGNASVLQGAVGLTDRSDDGREILSDAAGRLENEGAIGLVLGPPGAGKTALTLDIARVWAARTGGKLVGNTSWDGFDDVVRSDTELLEAMGHHDGPVLAVIDETAQELSGFGSSSKQAEAFSDALTFVRKREEEHGPYAKRGSVLMVNHTRTKTAKAFRDLASFGVEKPSRDDPGRAKLLNSEADSDEFEEVTEYKGISDTREQYDEHEGSEFVIHGVDDDDETGGGVDESDVKKREARRTVIRACKPWDDDSGASYEEAAELVDWSDSWVGNQIRDWKAGKFRDIVAKPDGETA